MQSDKTSHKTATTNPNSRAGRRRNRKEVKEIKVQITPTDVEKPVLNKKNRRQIEKAIENRVERKVFGQPHAHLGESYAADPRSKVLSITESVNAGKIAALPGSFQEYMSDLELFNMNRVYPGLTWSPYINNASVIPIPTGTFRIGRGLDQTPNATAFGAGDYLFVAWCPSLTGYTMGPVAGNSWLTPIAEGTRLGGLAIISGTASQSVNASNFLGTSAGYTAIQTYGSDFSSFSQGGMVWSAELDLNLVAPAANVTGAAYYGSLTFSQFCNSSLTIQSLMQTATHATSGGTRYILKSSVVNPDVVTDISYQVSNVNSYASILTNMPGIENEVVSYVILQTPVVSITTGTKTTYSLVSSIVGNYVYYPRANDPFSFSLGREAKERALANISAGVYEDLAKKAAEKGVVVSTDEWAKAREDTTKLMTTSISNLVLDLLKGEDNRTRADYTHPPENMSMFSFNSNRTAGPAGGRMLFEGRTVNEIVDLINKVNSQNGTKPSKAYSGSTFSTASTVSRSQCNSDEPIMVPKEDALYMLTRVQECLLHRPLTEDANSTIVAFSDWIGKQIRWWESQTAISIPLSTPTPPFNLGSLSRGDATPIDKEWVRR